MIVINEIVSKYLHDPCFLFSVLSQQVFTPEPSEADYGPAVGYIGNYDDTSGYTFLILINRDLQQLTS